MRKFDAKAKSLSRPVILEAKRRGFIRFFLTFLLSIALAACGGDSGTSVNDDNVSSSSVIQSGDSHEGSSNSKQSSSSKKGDAGKTSSSSAKTSSSSSSNKKDVSSSSSQKIASSSSTPRNDVKSSSSKRSEGDPSSSSQKITSSSSVKTVSSSSVILSSSEYVPFDHYTCLAGNWNVHKEAYKTFIDPRNGRSYYYYTATSYKTGRSVTVMAENLNIGEMVLGENDQNDDTKMERYCYNNDTTYCDKYGGLYQWAEMMQLPSRCNTESCSDWIEAQHQGICPDGWRLFTWRDYEIVKDYYDKYDEGIPLGLRSQCFSGYNTSGFSLIGAGARTINGGFEDVNETFFWRYPQEHEYDKAEFAYAAYVSRYSDDATGTAKNRRAEKIAGYSVRCTKIE